MGTNELNYLDNLIEEMREKEAEVKAISEEIDALKALVRDTMTTSEISEITTPNHHITYSQCERTTVDKKKLQASYVLPLYSLLPSNVLNYTIHWSPVRQHNRDDQH